VVASRPQGGHRLPCLADYELVSGDDYADLVVPFHVARVHVAHAAVGAASLASLALLVWQPCVAGHAAFSIQLVVEKLQIPVHKFVVKYKKKGENTLDYYTSLVANTL
jgi:hypothetical protein